MRSKFKWILTLVAAFLMQFSFAQEKTISGTVSGDGMPLPGATVLVKGTKNGTTTDFDGNFTIKAKQNDVLEISYVGYKTKSVTVGASNKVTVTLDADTQLEEVVVVGYGKVSKEGYTGTVAEVKKENIEAKTFSNVTQALRGEVAGVNVIQTTGQPGASAVIRIRGFGSVNGNRAPLYVVDGVPYSGDISAINQNDIENLNILKDAAATSIYGSRGANGVVLITTKSGKKEKSSISVDIRTSINTLGLPTYDVIESPEEYIELSWEAVRNRAILQGESNPIAFANANLYGGQGINNYYNIWNAPGDQLIDPTTGKFNSGVARRFTPENWADFAFRTGIRQEANVQFTNSTDKTSIATSLGYVDDQGYGINSDFRRYTMRMNIDHKVKDWLKVGANMSYAGSRSTQNGQSSDTGSIFLMANNSPRIYSIFLRDANGNPVPDPIFGGFQYDYGDSQFNDNGRRFSTATNGIADAIYNLNRSYNSSLFGNFSLDVNIAKGLTFETKYGAQIENFEDNDRENPFYGPGAVANGRLFKAIGSAFNENFLKLLRYNTTFGSDDEHSVEVFAAHESTKNTFKSMSAFKNNVILLNTLDLDQYTQVIGKPSSFSQRFSLESYFGQLNYNFKQKYFLTASIRRDGSSRFIRDKWGTFWSAGAGWVVSKENFMSDVKFNNFLKLKASYGVIGDQGTRIRYGWQIFSIGETDEYSFTPSLERANPNLTWETSKIAQVGFESSWFNNTIDLNVDYYVKDTENLFFNQSLPGSSGFSSVFINDGKLRNSGLEFDVNAHIFKGETPKDFSLSIGINGEVLSNKIVEMPIDLLSGERKVLDGALSQGKSIFDFYMREWAGVDPANGAGLWNMYYDDINGNGIFDSSDTPIQNMVLYLDSNPNAVVEQTTTTVYAQATQKYVGKSAIPKVRGAFRINTAYKNFDLSAQFSYSLGGYSYDNFYSWLMDNDVIGQNNWHTDVRDRWQQPGDITNVPRISDSFSPDAQFNAVSTRFLTKADFLSLNNLRLGYTFPSSILENTGISFLNLYVAGDNLMLLSHRRGFNPATSENGNSNIYRYNPISTYSLGVKVQF